MDNTSYQITLQIYQNQELTFQFEEGLTIFFGLHGSSRVFCGNQIYVLRPAGLLVVNPYEIYRVSCLANASVICMRIPRAMLDMAGWPTDGRCVCYAESDETEQPEERKIRELFAVIFQAYFEQSQTLTYASSREVMQLLGCLQSQFVTRDCAPPQRASTMQRLKRILDRVHDHWSEDISLSGIAKKEYLSVSYLSRFFQKNLHMSFTQYLKELRLSHAARMLIQTNNSVTQIAYDCGFRTPSMLIEAFKQQYKQTPGQFRQTQQMPRGQSTIWMPRDDLHGDVSALLAYVPEERMTELPLTTRKISAHCTDRLAVSCEPGRRILNIGYARDGLMAPIQEQIRRAQREIGFEYIRFHGVLDDDMHLYWEDQQGNPMFCFSYVDLLFDFIRSVGLKPFVELSFMPSVLAREQNKIFDRPSVISGCVHLDKWNALIRALLRHVIERYGREEVLRWRFTTISQSYVHLECVRWEDYQELFASTYHVVKQIDPALQFGGSGCFAEMLAQERGVSAFLRFAKERDCIPDFISFQFYPNIHTDDPLFMDFTLSQQSAPAILSEDTDYLVHSLAQMRNLMEQYGLSDREIYLEESTSTFWQRDLSSETCYKSAWLVKNMCDSFGHVVFGYWLLTDLIEERAMLQSLFHGGYGLLTYNGVPKAGYQAMQLFSRMGKTPVASGEGWLLTTSGAAYQLMTYNYCHHSNLYRYRYQRLEQPRDAYSVFETGEIQQMQFWLDELESGTYRIERRAVTREQGSSFDKWLELGAPCYPSEDELDYLRRAAEPSYRIETVSVRDTLHVEVLLHPMEIEYLLIHRVDSENL